MASTKAQEKINNVYTIYYDWGQKDHLAAIDVSSKKELNDFIAYIESSKKAKVFHQIFSHSRSVTRTWSENEARKIVYSAFKWYEYYAEPKLLPDNTSFSVDDYKTADIVLYPNRIMMVKQKVKDGKVINPTMAD